MTTLRITLGSPDASALLGHKVKVDGHTVTRIASDVTEIDVPAGWHIIDIADLAHPTRPLRLRVVDGQDVDCAVRRSHPQRLLFGSWFDLDRIETRTA